MLLAVKTKKYLFFILALNTDSALNSYVDAQYEP